MIRHSWIALLIALTLCMGGAVNTVAEFIEIDVVINIMSTPAGPVATTQEAEEAIAKANEILKPTGVRLNVVKVNSNPSSAPVSAGNADGDASLTDDEWRKALEAGEKELDRVVGAGKGMKFTIAANPEAANPANPGVSTHKGGGRRPSRPSGPGSFASAPRRSRRAKPRRTKAPTC